jgi:hypothetical protein
MRIRHEPSLNVSRRDHQLDPILSDPTVWMVRAGDRDSVELVQRCLRAGLASGRLSPEDSLGAQSMMEDCEAWLAEGSA